MAAKQSSETDKQGGKDKQQEANLGQKEAREEKEKKSELSSLGEGSRESSHDHNQKRDSDSSLGDFLAGGNKGERGVPRTD